MDSRIIRAIEGRWLVAFTYHGSPRVVEPHVYGRTNGVDQLLGYQTGGQSRSGRIPEWRRFDVRQMSGLEVLDQQFGGSRDDGDNRHSAFDAIYAVVR